MADFTQINQEIDDNINQNGVNAITGAKMNTVLKDMVSAVNNEKQDTIADIEEIRSGAEAGSTAYQKPSGGIPATDMDENVQTALDNAEKAVLYSEQSAGITDQQRNTALANVSNQTANSTTGKMGYKVLDPTKTFAEQVTAENTIYEIRDVFDLGGTQETPVSVTLPANSTLKFNGGKIINGSINGNNTNIQADAVSIFDETTILSGSFSNNFAYLDWWSVIEYDNQTEYDNSEKIKAAFRSPFPKYVVSKKYGISKPINGGKIIEGRNKNNFKNCGFIANSNFSSADVTLSRDNVTYTVRGMFYHSYDQLGIFKDLSIDGNFSADFCVEHLAGYSWINMYSVYICNARVCGMLQYGCEQPIWENVRFVSCNIGLYVSNKELNEQNPLSPGAVKGSANIVRSTNCSWNACNYGIIIEGYDCSILGGVLGNNNRFGAVISGSGYIGDIYSEGDGRCLKWLHDDGTTEEGEASGYGMKKTCPYMITSNIDGYSCTKGYIRAPILFMNAYYVIDRLNLSNYPRSYYSSPTTAQVLGYDERQASGVDTYLLADKGGKITIQDISVFRSPNDTGAFVANTIGLSSPYEYIDYPVINLGYCNANNNIVELFSPNNTLPFYNKGNGKAITMPSINERRDYNYYADKYGYYGYSYDYMNPKSMEFVECYNGFPLYKWSTSTKYQSYILENTNFSKVFTKKSFVAKAYVKVLEDTQSSYLSLDCRFNSQDSALVAIFRQGTTDVKRDVYAGEIYELSVIIEVPDAEFARLVCRVDTNLNYTKIARSKIYFYEVGDVDTIAPINTEYNLVGGTTAQRPTVGIKGHTYFDTDLNKTIVWNGTAWVNLDGTSLS